jgi:hypothetical protein
VTDSSSTPSTQSHLAEFGVQLRCDGHGRVHASLSAELEVIHETVARRGARVEVDGRGEVHGLRIVGVEVADVLHATADVQRCRTGVDHVATEVEIGIAAAPSQFLEVPKDFDQVRLGHASSGIT